MIPPAKLRKLAEQWTRRAGLLRKSRDGDTVSDDISCALAHAASSAIDECAADLTALLDAAEVNDAPPTLPSGGKRTCNRHDDCDEADRRARENGRDWADHCHDDCCEDCFGS